MFWSIDRMCTNVDAKGCLAQSEQNIRFQHEINTFAAKLKQQYGIALAVDYIVKAYQIVVVFSVFLFFFFYPIETYKTIFYFLFDTNKKKSSLSVWQKKRFFIVFDYMKWEYLWVSMHIPVAECLSFRYRVSIGTITNLTFHSFVYSIWLSFCFHLLFSLFDEMKTMRCVQLKWRKRKWNVNADIKATADDEHSITMMEIKLRIRGCTNVWL